MNLSITILDRVWASPRKIGCNVLILTLVALNILSPSMIGFSDEFVMFSVFCWGLQARTMNLRAFVITRLQSTHLPLIGFKEFQLSFGQCYNLCLGGLLGSGSYKSIIICSNSPLAWLTFPFHNRCTNTKSANAI